MKSAKPAPSAPQTWAEDVFAAGRLKPWDGRKRLKHDAQFLPSAVTTDGLGNVLDMPLLRDKWCFGRPEVYVRQVNQTTVRKFYWGVKEVPTTRCGKCQITRACEKLANERIQSSRPIYDALVEWKEHCKASSGRREFSGPAGRLWQKFLQAIANHGMWASSNDEKLREDQLTRVRAKLEKECARKRAERERDRERRRDLRLPLDREVVDAILIERNRRCNLLEQAAGKPGQHPAIAKITKEYRESTAAFTADTWMVDVLLGERGFKPNASMIAKTLIKMGRDQGKSYSALRQRVRNDLDRVRVCEQGNPPLWRHFSIGDKLEQNEIDAIMSELDFELNRVIWGWD